MVFFRLGKKKEQLLVHDCVYQLLQLLRTSGFHLGWSFRGRNSTIRVDTWVCLACSRLQACTPSKSVVPQEAIWWFLRLFRVFDLHLFRRDTPPPPLSLPSPPHWMNPGLTQCHKIYSPVVNNVMKDGRLTLTSDQYEMTSADVQTIQL